MNTAPTTLNHLPVIHAKSHANGFVTVMVRRSVEEIVVATWWPSLKTEWSWGHYCFDLDEASLEFGIVSTRNNERGPLGA